MRERRRRRRDRRRQQRLGGGPRRRAEDRRRCTARQGARGRRPGVARSRQHQQRDRASDDLRSRRPGQCARCDACEQRLDRAVGRHSHGEPDVRRRRRHGIGHRRRRRASVLRDHAQARDRRVYRWPGKQLGGSRELQPRHVSRRRHQHDARRSREPPRRPHGHADLSDRARQPRRSRRVELARERDRRHVPRGRRRRIRRGGVLGHRGLLLVVAASLREPAVVGVRRCHGRDRLDVDRQRRLGRQRHAAVRRS